jgi:competence protein ComGC
LKSEDAYSRKPVKTSFQKVTVSNGFTFVELLVVIGCIFVLTILMMPALAGTRQRTQHVVCMNNLKQLTLAEIMYCEENTHSIPDTAADGMTGMWFVNLKYYFGGASNLMMMCPTANQAAIQPGTSVSVGNAVTPWCRVDVFGDFSSYFGSYSFNGWLFTKRTDATQGDGDGTSEIANSGGYFLTGSAIKFPNHTPVFSDGFWVDGWPLETDSPCHDTRGTAGPSSPNLGTANGQEMARFAMARHVCNPFAANTWTTPTQTPTGKVNVGCFDGHVEPSSLPHLWNYYWHNGWNPAAVHIGTPY